MSDDLNPLQSYITRLEAQFKHAADRGRMQDALALDRKLKSAKARLEAGEKTVTQDEADDEDLEVAQAIPMT